MAGLDPRDVAETAKVLRTGDGKGDETYRTLRDAIMRGPIPAGRILSELLLSNPEKGLEGKVKPYYYQEPTIGHMLMQTWDTQDYLFPTGCGKTQGVSMGGSLRMYFKTVKGAIIAATDDQTKYIRDTVHDYYLHGHPMLRNALVDSAKDRVVVQRPNGDISELVCRTANLNNSGDSLLGLQGLTDIYIDERSILPDAIFNEKVDRITAPQGIRRLMVGITTTQVTNHTAEWTEAHLLPRRENCVATVPHITRLGPDLKPTRGSGAVFKATWREGLKVGRYDMDFIRRRYKSLGEELFSNWYECEFSLMGDEEFISSELWRLMVE